MKIIIIIFFFLFFVNESFPQSNYNNFTHYFGVQLNTGATFFNLSSLKDSFQNYVTSYKDNYNIPLKVQRLYPTNISWSFYFFWYFSQNFSLNFGPEYTSTRAFSRYSDYSGTLDIKGEIEEIYLSLGIKKHFPEVPYVQPFLGLTAGVTQFKFTNDVNLVINNIPQTNYNNFEDSDYGYFFELNTGFTYNINIAVLEFDAYYKMVNLDRFIIDPNNFSLQIGIKKGIFK